MTRNSSSFARASFSVMCPFSDNLHRTASILTQDCCVQAACRHDAGANALRLPHALLRAKAALQFADERLELDLKRRIVVISPDQPHNRAADRHSLHLLSQFRHMLRLRDAEPDGERQVGYGTYRAHQ